MKFTKMQAYGNDYVYIDAINQKLDNLSELSKYLSDRHFGVGSDGIVLICPSTRGDFRMRMFNPDGTEGEMCGNALRSMSMYVYEHGLTDKTDLLIETLGGMQKVRLFVKDGHVIDIEANIGRPVLDTARIPVNTELPEFIEQRVRVIDRDFDITAVSWGNPHCVMFVDDVDNFDVEKYGRAIEHMTELFPNKTNVTFAELVDRHTIKIREWERGTGETIGCGTGCCTAMVAGVLTGRCARQVSVRQIGGVLETRWDEGVVYMRGPSHTVFESEIDVSDIIGRARMLRNLLEGMDFELIRGSLDTEICDLKYDSRFVGKNDLFLARVGANSDSHEFIPAAVERGARVVVIERDVQVEGDVTVVKVPSSKLALALMSASYFGHPARELVTVGVTGTAGKTSTTFMLRAMLEAAGRRVGLIGTVGAYVDGRKTELHNTTPESYEIQKLLRQMCDAGCDCALMEVSSQGLKMNRVDGFTFDYGVFTNITPDHIGPNEHTDFEDYLHAKSLLFRRCRVGIVNADAEHVEDILKGSTCEVIRYGVRSADADERAEDVRFLMDGSFMGVEFKTRGLLDGEWRVPVPGRFSVYNSLGALTVAFELGVPAAAVAEALAGVSVAGRMELVSSNDTYKLIVDYAHNADEMDMLMETVLEYRPGRLVCIFGGGGNRARARRFDMGRIAAKHADLIILTEDNPRYEELESINADIIEGIAGGCEYITIDDRFEAIYYAVKNAQVGDVILLIGKGHEQYQEVRGVRSHWDEVEAVRRAEAELQ